MAKKKKKKPLPKRGMRLKTNRKTSKTKKR